MGKAFVAHCAQLLFSLKVQSSPASMSCSSGVLDEVHVEATVIKVQLKGKHNAETDEQRSKWMEI